MFMYILYLFERYVFDKCTCILKKLFHCWVDASTVLTVWVNCLNNGTSRNPSKNVWKCLFSHNFIYSGNYPMFYFSSWKISVLWFFWTLKKFYELVTMHLYICHTFSGAPSCSSSCKMKDESPLGYAPGKVLCNARR